MAAFDGEQKIMHSSFLSFRYIERLMIIYYCVGKQRVKGGSRKGWLDQWLDSFDLLLSYSKDLLPFCI